MTGAPTSVRLKTAILVAFAALGALYSVVTPIFEASDERWHYPLVDHIATKRNLPVQDPAQATAWHQEGSQPPLYYCLSAVVAAIVDADDVDRVLRPNPHAVVGLPLEIGNKNMILHSAREAWPWHGTTLAVHLVRLLSVAMGVATVWLTWNIGARLWPGNDWLPPLAASLTAFNPMYLFISASVNNDALAAPLAAAGAYVLIRALCHPRGQRLAHGMALGLILGFGALTKISCLALLPVVAAGLTWDAIRRRQWRPWLINGVLIAALIALIAGWWYWRNWTLYGDLTGVNRMLDIAGRRHEAFTMGRLWAEFEGFRISYWAQFGALNILASRWIYRVLDALVLVALGGLVTAVVRWFLVRRGGRPEPSGRKRDDCPSWPVLLLLAGWVLVVLVSLVRWTSQTYASQGRLMFVAIAGISCLWATGLLALVPAGLRRWVAGAMMAPLLILAAACPFVYILPAYVPSPLLQAADLPPEMVPVNRAIDGHMRLVGFLPLVSPQSYRPAPGADEGLVTVRPAEALPLTIYWQVLEPMERDLSVFVKLTGRQGQVVGQVNTYPGLGTRPTGSLAPGDIVADTYHIPVAGDAEAPSLLKAHAGLYDYMEPGRPALPATNDAGNPDEPFLAEVRLVPWDWPAVSPRVPLAVDFGEAITLVGYDLELAAAGEDSALTLYWSTRARPDGDFTVFIQLWDENRQLAGFDGRPVNGDYPTSWWSAGERIVDRHILTLPDAEGKSPRLLLGLYSLDGGARLPARAHGTAMADSAVVIEMAP